MIMPLTADDVVVGILYFLRQGQQDQADRFTSDREKLHDAFYRLKQQHPSLMSHFSFRDRGQFYESNELDQALSNLDAAGLISRFNLTPRNYMIQSLLEKSYQDFSKDILNKAQIDESELRNAAAEIMPDILDTAS